MDRFEQVLKNGELRKKDTKEFDFALKVKLTQELGTGFVSVYNLKKKLKDTVKKLVNEGCSIDEIVSFVKNRGE